MTRLNLWLPTLFSALAVAVVAGCASSPGVQLPSDRGLSNLVRFQDANDFRPDPKALGTPDTNESQPSSADRKGRDAPPAAQVVKRIEIEGNQTLAEHEIMRRIRTRPGRFFDPDLLQQDVNELWKMKQIRRVNGPFIDRQEDGIVISIEVSERPYVNEVKYIGNRALPDRQLAQETGLRGGQPLDLHAVKMAQSRLEDLYHEKGFPQTEVTIVEGTDAEDRDIVFLIHEDELQRVWRVTFKGNEVASDARLKSFIKMKPSIVPLIGGKFNRRELEQDRLRLESYYRRLGYFNARIGRELEVSDNRKWMTIHYVINEGPRYRIRSVSFIGNEKYTTEELESVVKLKTDDQKPPFFDATKMNRDVQRLEDLYGSQGHVFAKIQAEPRFLETPGVLDLVYNITEGKQYRVGEINVVIDGDYGVTQRQVILNRLGLRPGDLIDTRKLREAEARLVRSQLFADGSPSSPGNPPKLVIKPPELDDLQDHIQRR